MPSSNSMRWLTAPAMALLAAAAVGALAGRQTPAQPESPRARHTVNYGRPFEPPTRPALIPLPPGAVEPRGWLRDWCLTARDGYTGHMEEFSDEFRKSWAADYKMTGDKLAYWWQGAWPYEGGGYWFDGMLRLGYALHDEALIAKARARLDVVADHLNPNSILFMWWLDRNRPEDMRASARQDGGEAQEWPCWTNGFMGRSLTGYYAATGDKRILRALEMAYGGDRSMVRRGFALTNPWPAFETYTWTGNPEIKAALSEFYAANPIDATPPAKPVRLYDSWYNRMPDPRLPFYAQPDHGVHFNESVIPWALGALWTGNRDYLTAAQRWYDLIEQGDDGMQPHGLPVSDENSGPTGSFRGSETCNVPSYMWSQITLLRVGGEARSADRVERAFFNAGPAAVSRDFRSHVYSQAPNRISAKLPDGGGLQYRATHWPLCCTASVNRMLPYYVGHMWMATYDNGLAAAHYGPCKVTAVAGDRVAVDLVCRTDYPFNDVIDVDVSPSRPASFPLSFRVPGWCSRPEFRLNGSRHTAKAGANGFVRIERRWKPGDRIRLRFPTQPAVRLGHDNNAADTPYATVSYGPLLFALPIQDTADCNTPDPAARWQVALDATQRTGITVVRRPMPARWDWPLASPLMLRVRVRGFDWQPVTRIARSAGPAPAAEASPFQPKTVTTMLPAAPVSTGSPPETVTLVPYGCTKFRISMFPVTEKARRTLRPPPRRR